MSTIDFSIAARYQEALSTLHSLQTNEAVLKTPNSLGRTPEDIIRYLSLLNVRSEDIDRLNVIHVAGTKGKGSTCAFTESILRQYGYKTGFYSSPHLIEVRERIKINGEMISKEKFIDYFWICYKTLNEAVQKSTEQDPLIMPFYFAFLTTMMFYVFIHEKIEVAVIEVGIGGERDCTNIIKKPIACGITSLGFDHVKLLGNTIDKIAWQKAGIFKSGTYAVTAPQPPDAMRVLFERAEEKRCSLIIVPPLKQYQNYPFQLSLAGEIQEINAAVAIQLVFFWLHAKKVQSYPQLMSSPLSAEVLRGLATCSWFGRNQILRKDNVNLYMDGAHTVESIEQCKHWFLDAYKKENQSKPKILIFYCSGDRQADVLLRPLMSCQFDHVIFCGLTSASIKATDQKSQKEPSKTDNNVSVDFERIQKFVDSFKRLLDSEQINSSTSYNPSIHCFKTVNEALAWISKNNFSEPSVLVTGSLYLIGAVLSQLESNNSKS